MSRKADYISAYRQQATAAINALLAMEALHKEARVMNYPSSIPPEDFVGSNADITKPQFAQGKTAMDNILTMLTDAILLDLYRIRL